MKLLIATPSPFARKARIALLEKGIEHELAVDNPWSADAAIGALNPLGKVPALLLDDGRVLHDSKVIVEYLESLEHAPPLLPADPAARIAHKQIEAIADGVCDACVLVVLERARPAALQSRDWIVRQEKKMVAGCAELARLLGDGESFTAHGFGLAEIATGCALAYLDLRAPQIGWRAAHPALAAFSARLEARPSFRATRPVAQPVRIDG